MKPIILLHRNPYPEQKNNTTTAQLCERGFTILHDVQLSAQGSKPFSGVLLQQEADIAAIEHALTVCAKEKPLLALVYGEDVPRGLADRLQAKYNAKQPKVEVVRLFLFPDCERAVLGGDNEGYWTRELRLHLAWHQMITLLCRRAEVDEVVHHLPLFLSWKKYFYQLLGERCDESKARLEVVARALGMDKRVGQGWLPTVTASGYEDRYLSRWLERQWQYVRKKTNIERVAVWGTSALCEGIFSELARGSDVRLYLSGDTEKANRLASNCSIYAQPKDTLDGADLLLIVATDQAVAQFSLHDLTNRMRQWIVIDACSCYPLEEMQRYGIKYRTYGQNTNVWEWN